MEQEGDGVELLRDAARGGDLRTPTQDVDQGLYDGVVAAAQALWAERETFRLRRIVVRVVGHEAMAGGLPAARIVNSVVFGLP